MSVTFVAAKKLAGGTATSGTIAKPTGVEPSDVLVATFIHFASNKVMSLSGEWAKLKEVQGGSSNFRAATFIKRAIAGEGTEYTLSWEGSESKWRSGLICAYRGVRTSGNPYDDFSLAIGGSASLNAVAPSINEATANSVLVWHEISQNASAITGPGGYTSRETLATEGMMADITRETTGATGEVTGALGTSVYSAAGLIALPPAGATGVTFLRRRNHFF
jgi:hypothetical protein